MATDSVIPWRGRLSRYWSDVAFLLFLTTSAVLLACGLLFPAFTTDRLGSDPESFSIVSGVMQLHQHGSTLLAVVVGLFSVVFPVAKLGAMAFLRIKKLPARREILAVRALEMLGKWSMLDVFVVATLIGAARLKFINEVSPEQGVYLFAYAILASLIASYLLAESLATVRRPTYEAPGRLARAGCLILGLISLLFFALGLALPLMHIEKWLFWDKEYSLLEAMLQMWSNNEQLLPAVIGLFVILLPILRFLSLLGVRTLGDNTPPLLTRVAFSLEKWSMWDVYALALVVVIVKLGDFAAVEPRLGFWLIVIAISLSAIDGWSFRSRVRFDKGSSA